MQLISTILNKTAPLLLFGLTALLFVSCGAHQENDFRDVDGIYSNGEQATAETTEDSSKDTYYKQYFNSKTGAYDELPEEGAIFTDIDAYHTTDTMNREGEIVIEEVNERDYAGWGENSGQVTVNVYDNGFNNGFVGGGFWNRPFWWYGAGWGFNNYWCSPFTPIGFGWGHPFYGNFGWGFPLNNGGFYNNFNNPYYGNTQHGYAFTRGRRSSDFNNGRMASRGRNANSVRSNRQIAERGRSRYSNNRTATQNRANSARDNRTSRYRQNSRNTQSKFNTNRARTNSNTRTTRPATKSRSNSKSRTNTSRSSSPSRSNSTRSSRGGSRSSGARSGGSRGGSRSGGGRGRGGRGF